GVWKPIMPRFQQLRFHRPTSSPKITRTFGFFLSLSFLSSWALTSCCLPSQSQQGPKKLCQNLRHVSFSQELRRVGGLGGGHLPCERVDLPGKRRGRHDSLVLVSTESNV